jgi:UDPglucose 6-dehydrogenase
MTEWDEFRRLKAKDYIAQMRQPVLVDARRIYNPAEFAELKFAGIGFG